MNRSKTLEKIALVAFGVVLMGAALFQGCAGPKKPGPSVGPTVEIKQLGQDIANTGRDLKVTTTTIRDNANEGIKMTPPPVLPTLSPYWNNILTATGVQDQLVKNLDAMTKRAEEAEQLSTNFQKKFDDEHKARLKAEDSVTKQLRQKYLAYSGILFFIALICGGVAVFSKGNKLALYGGLVAGAGAAACIFVVQTVALIPWIVGGLGLIGLALLVYTLFFKNKQTNGLEKEKNVLEQGVAELVETVEAVKPRMTMAGRAKVFGDGPTKGDAYAIQSKSTEALVKKFRKNIENAPKLPATVAVDYNGDGVIDEKDAAIAAGTVTFNTPVELVSPQRSLATGRKKVFN